MATTALRPAATYRPGLYDWLTTTDHKKIGILYFFNSLLLFLIGGLLALAVRSELAQPGRAIGEVLLACPKVTHVYCGHSHWPGECQIGHVRVVNVGSTYTEKRMVTLDV